MRTPLLAAALLLLAGSPAAADDDEPPPAGQGTLHLSARPACSVELDGSPIGNTRALRRGIDLAAGTYVVRFVCDAPECAAFEQKTGKKTLTVEAGGTTRYMADFYALNGESKDPAEPDRTDRVELPPVPDGPTGTLVLTGTPGARVNLDGAAVGRVDADTPLTLTLQPGEYVVRFTCDGDACDGFSRRSGRKTLLVQAGTEVRYEVDFHALNGVAP